MIKTGGEILVKVRVSYTLKKLFTPTPTLQYYKYSFFNTIFINPVLFVNKIIYFTHFINLVSSALLFLYHYAFLVIV